MTKQKQATKPNDNFSKILDEMRNLGIAITKDKRIRVKYKPEQPTSAFNMENFEISLSLAPYPDFVKSSPRLFRKIMDGDLAHECGHLILTKPNWEFFNNWTTKIKRQRGFYRLAHEVCNLIEDKRVNHFIILRYRFDVGKRLLLANLILKDMIDNTIEPKQIAQSTFTPLGENLDATAQAQQIQQGQQEGVYMVAILCNEGLYEAKCTELWNKLSPETTKDCKQALKVMEEVKYKRVKLDIIRACQEVYELIAKHLKADYTSKNYVVSRRGGDLKGKISDKLRELLEAEDAKETKDEEDKKKHLEDLQKGSGAGEGSISGTSKVYVKLDGKLWYGTITELEQQRYERLEVQTEKDYKIVWREAKLINHGIGFLFKITVKSGKEVKATANHNLFKRRFVHSSSSRLFVKTRTDDLKIGDSIAIPSILPIETNNLKIEDDVIYLSGLWFADGNYGIRCIEYSLNGETDKSIIEKLRQIGKRKQITVSVKQDNGKGVRIRFFSVKLIDELKLLGCVYPKQIPNWVFVSSDRQITIFLEGYTDGDGHEPQNEKHKDTTQISCFDKTVIDDLQTLFLRLGIFSHIAENKGERLSKKSQWVLETTRKRYPEITFRQIKNIEPLGYETIYDFSVPKTEKFIANNILLHNTGEEIPAPEPDFEAYSKLLDECKPEISELLNLLKKQLKPKVQREIFQKRGKMMSPIVPRIYTNSFRGTVRNVYLRTTTKFEKEQVAIQFWFDFSGSVNRKDAEKITTVLNEVFGHFVDDYGFSIGCFGADTQKIKTFFETFQNTRARIGAITVNAGGTEVSVGLEASLKMFNSIRGERRKILVIASDFEFCDDEKAEELIQQYAKAGIECIFIGFCDCDKVEQFARNVRNLRVSRTRISQVSELPLKFLQVYLGVQLQK